MRVNLNYFISDAVLDYLLEAVRIVASDGWRLLHDYRFDPLSGLWHHRNGPIEPPMRLARRALRRRRDAVPAAPRPAPARRPSQGYLDDAVELLRTVPQHLLEPEGPLPLSRDFELLRWFELPPGCLAPTG